MFGANDYPFVPLYLSIYILNYAWEGLGGMSLSTLISGIGESRISLRASVITFLTGVTLALVLVPWLGMVGILITIVLDSRGGWVHNTFWVKRNLGITVDWNSTIRTYLVGFTAFVASYLVSHYFTNNGILAVAAGVVTYFAVYVLGVVVSGVLRHSDLKLIEGTINAKGLLAQIVHKVLDFLARFERV